MDFWMRSTLQPVFLMALQSLSKYLRSALRMRSICSYSETTTVLSMSVFGAERQNWMSMTLALSTFLILPQMLLLRTSPSTISLSSTVPPRRSTTRTSFKSTLLFSKSATLSTESTAIGARMSAFWYTILDEREMVAAWIRESRSLRSTGMAMSRRISLALASALTKQSAMMVGCTPFSSSMRTASRKAPAMTTTDVVPSPASMSCDLEMPTSILAVGWNTCMRSKMVAPSLVMMTSPVSLWIILSMPRGPSEVRTASATALAAMMLPRRMSFSLAESLALRFLLLDEDMVG
mmetsp:Transcript_23828/g.34820  ORF Transcript_23828/g.34820 Transcript_23828/m.34820 type:complete len:292 (-) Transcript_23828:52-927(-)